MLQRRADAGRASITLEYETGWNRNDFGRKARALEDLAVRGRLSKGENPATRDPSLTRQYKNRLVRRAYEEFGRSDPATFRRLRDRIRQMHPDHMQDLQLVGADDAMNLWLLDADVNTGLGRQIWQQIRLLRAGTMIDRVIIRGF